MEKQRLLALADFLEKRVPRKAWSFRTIVTLGTKSPKDAFEAGGGCGTTACAVGWMPQCFPDDFVWSDGGYGTPDVVLTSGESSPYRASYTQRNILGAAQYFGITEQQADFLFIPHEEVGEELLLLPRTATKEEVAERIRHFVEANGTVEPNPDMDECPYGEDCECNDW